MVKLSNIINLVENQDITGISNELKSFYIAKMFESGVDSILFVCNSLYEATQYYQMISNYSSEVLFFPMDDFLTSEALAVSPEFKSTRLETLQALIGNNKKIVVTNLMGYLRFLPKKEVFKTSNLKLEVGREQVISDLVKKLFNMGYIKEVNVNKTGEIGVRGFVLDIFPINEENPYRIEFFGDNIESIRTFDINTQRTIKKVEEVNIFPNTELILSDDIDTFGLKQREMVTFETPSTIEDYIDGTIIFNEYNEIKIGYELLSEEVFEYKLSSNLDKEIKFFKDLFELKSNYRTLSNFDSHSSEKVFNYNSKDIELFSGGPKEISVRLNNYIKSNKTVIICVTSRYVANKITEELDIKDVIFTNESEIYSGKINIIVKKMEQGFTIDEYVVISENDLFGHKKNSEVLYKTKFKMGTKIRDLNKLNKGDFVVHINHGIGQYNGITTLEKNGMLKDYLLINYRDQDKLYLPVEKIELLSKYSPADGIVPKLNKLGSLEWEKTKIRVKNKIESIALELMNLYALREATPGFSFPEDDSEQLEFEKDFPYEETDDQLKVIEEIKEEMQSGHPMDRLLCGDVGYGKTEVAFRAVFKAISGGKQVALLCPTTILSNQHYKNAMNRFLNFPVNIEILNRFNTQQEVNKVLEKVKNGKVDLLIGTHRILSDDVNFKDLGLLIVDEEQRFGVKHKEKIKEYKHNIDVLTLSATPIPRTLQMSMSGLRSLSLIETPPVNRYPIQTYVLAENNPVIKDVIYKELSRNGQAYILFNNIANMESKKREIETLIPDAKIITANGRMNKNELEDIMLRFVNKEYDILLCTTIIETGIDIANVNTLIIFDADKFGLSQLYQIRGRVGRTDKIAYCYLMYDKKKILSEIAIKRLKAIKEFTELGSGFSIAMRDLAIRGAGDILGKEQAGFVDSVGMELFMDMLEKEIKKLKGEIIEEETVNIQPLIEVSTAINDNYIFDEELKIEIHKKINEIDSTEKFEQIKSELEDRFGKISENLMIYMNQQLVEKYAKDLGIEKIKQTKNFVEIILPKALSTKELAPTIFYEANNITRMFRFGMKNNYLIITLDTVKLEKHFVYYIVKLFSAIKEAKEKNVE